MSTPRSDSFDSSYNQAASTVQTISVGVIVVIVLSIVAGFGSIIAGFCLWNRSKKRRRAKNAAFEPMSTANHYQYGGGNGQYSSSANPASTPYVPASPYSGQMELYGSTVSPRFEIPNTPAPYPEAAGREVCHEKTSRDSAQAELGGNETKRSEMP